MTVTIRCPVAGRGGRRASEVGPVTVAPVPLVAAAVCPHPPLLVPEVAAGAAAELDDLRAACDAALTHLLDRAPDVLVVVGGGERTAHLASPYAGDLRPWGADVTYRLGHGRPSAVRPLSLLIGGWLVDRHGGGAEVALATVASDAPPGTCAAFGAELAGHVAAGAGVAAGESAGPRVALLAMGDGSACHGPKAPGYADPRADAYHRGVVAALGGADAGALLALEPGLSAELRVAGRAAWQVLAGAAGGGWRGEVRYDAAPYGVGYVVATWSPA